MLKILIGFDYELFLGENYANHKDILINPTDQILELLKENDVPATLFADVCCALQYKKYGQTDFVNDFEGQLKRAQKNGFDIQLHIHSNWLNSSFDGQKWDISLDGYRIHAFGFGEDGARKIIKDGIEYLHNILRDENPEYKCVAYRAGGYSIQPHSELVRVLRENGILIDSSVCRHIYVDSNANKYDFRKVPAKMNWWLTPDKDFAYEGCRAEGGLFEVPVCSDNNSLFKRIFWGKEKLVLPSSDTPNQNGTCAKLEVVQERRPSKLKILLNYNRIYSLVSFDATAPERLFAALKKIEKKYNTKKNDVYVSILGHPKLCNAYVLAGMKQFVEQVNLNKDRFAFISFRQLYDELCEQNDSSGS